MQEEKIIEFLIRAKKATYAGKGPEVTSSRPKSKDLEYSEASLKYLDTYLGTTNFAGEEALWEEGQPIWAMNYCGQVLDDNFKGDFLKEVLLHVPLDKPFRGPSEYIKGEFIYNSVVKGKFEWFNGCEEIYYKNIKVYECLFHGGSIK